VQQKNKRIQQVKAHYFETKEECEKMLDENGNDHERKTFNDIVAQESAFFATNSPIKIQEKSDELHSIIGKIRWRTPDFLVSIFQWCKNNQTKMNDQTQAKSLVDAGNFAIESENWERLSEINSGLIKSTSKRCRKRSNYKNWFWTLKLNKMKNTDFKTFLFKSAVMAMACDGDIAEEEINEIKNIVANEIYFMGYDFEEPLKSNIENIKVNGKNAINQYLQEIVTNDLNEHQEILLN
jgi:predicted nucleic acid-binding protein